MLLGDVPFKCTGYMSGAKNRTSLFILTSDSHNSSRILREIFFKQSSSRLKQYLRAGWSMRRKGERETVRKLSSMSRKSLFHVLKLHSLPPLFYNFIFSSASKWMRSCEIRSLCLEKHFAETGLF